MGEGERVTEWETGLPAADDLPPLGQALIPPGLASAFSISLEPCKTFLDVARASETTFSGIRLGTVGSSIQMPDDDLIGDDEVDDDGDRSCKLRRIDSAESETAEEGGKGAKRPRLVWTPQLHKRFVDVVAHLGIKNAVPKTIMQLMNVEGLTRENVASHLQKYRLYLKRMQGGSGGGPEQPPSDGNEYPNGSGDSNNSNSDGGSSNGYQVAFHPHPGVGLMMPVPMPMYGHLGSNGGGGSSNHHHHHFHHHQHQFNGYGAGGNGGNQSGFDATFGFHGGSYMVPSSDA